MRPNKAMRMPGDSNTDKGILTQVCRRAEQLGERTQEGTPQFTVNGTRQHSHAMPGVHCVRPASSCATKVPAAAAGAAAAPATSARQMARNKKRGSDPGCAHFGSK